MKISILGKLVLLLFFSIQLFGGVSATVDKNNFYMGDQITLSLRGSGEDIVFPTITKIASYPILGTSSSQQISIINGKTSKTKVMQYSFTPTNSLEIPSFSIKIDGKEEKTQPIKLTMVEPTPSTKDDPIQLQITTDKSSYYVGEPIVVSLLFKYKTNISIIDAKLAPFEPDGFWKKDIPSPQPKEENGYISYQINHLLFAKQSGKTTIPNHSINIAKRDFRNYIQWEKVFSNKHTIDIKPLPKDISIVGDFSFDVSVDKTQTNPNEPINLTIRIEGSGNIEDIAPFSINLPNQVLYNSKPEITSNVIKNKLMGNFVQKISIVSDKDYTIPPLFFSYFDLQSQTIKTIQSKPIDIKLNQLLQKETPKIETLQTPIEPQVITKIEYVEKDTNQKYIFGVIGFIVGVFITMVFYRYTKKIPQKEDIGIIKQIKKAKNDKELYDILLPYIQDKEISQYIKQLEKNIFTQSNDKIEKEKMITYIRESFGV